MARAMLALALSPPPPPPDTPTMMAMKETRTTTPRPSFTMGFWIKETAQSGISSRLLELYCDLWLAVKLEDMGNAGCELELAPRVVPPPVSSKEVPKSPEARSETGT